MDDDQIWSQEVTTVLRVHEKPTAEILTITPEVPNEGDVVWFEGEGRDDTFIKSYKWTSNIDGDLGNEAIFTAILTQGTHTISFSVMDEFNVWSKVDTQKLTINDIPEAVIDFVFPNPVFTGDLVSLRGHGEDDGQIEAHQWSSSLDGVIGSESSISLSDLSIGTHSIYLKVKDNYDVWSPEAITSLTVQQRANVEPTVSFINPQSNDVIYDEIFIHVEAEDEIDNIERIEIRVDDNNWFLISETATGYYTMDVSEVGTGKHVLYARAFDGELYSEEEFVIIEIQEADEGGTLQVDDPGFIILIAFIIIPIIAAILLYYIFVVRRRRRRDFIKL
jgi:hypothetical protein